MAKTLNSIKGLEIISADAFKVGIVNDIRYDPIRWKVASIKVKTEKDVTKFIPSLGSGRSMIQMTPRDFMINDVLLMSEEIGGLEPFIAVDSENSPALSAIDGMKVISKEGIEIGSVYDVNLDTDTWVIPTISIKLEKTGFEPLGLKKGLLSKTVISVRTEYIESVTTMVMLNQTTSEMRDDMVVE